MSIHDLDMSGFPRHSLVLVHVPAYLGLWNVRLSVLQLNGLHYAPDKRVTVSGDSIRPQSVSLDRLTKTVLLYFLICLFQPGNETSYMS